MVRHLKKFCFYRQIVYKETVLSEYTQEVAFYYINIMNGKTLN